MTIKYRNQRGIPPQDMRVAGLESDVTDYTGRDPDFRITNETILNSSILRNTFSLSKGAFFDESVLVVRSNDLVKLDHITDYEFKVLDTGAVGASHKSIHCVIVLKEAVDCDLIVSYQYVGGKHVHQRDTLINLLSSVDGMPLDNIFYSQLLNRPTSFNTTVEHNHDASTIVGMDDEVAVLGVINETLKELINNVSGDSSPMLSFLRALIDDLQRVKQDRLDPLLDTENKNVVEAINEVLETLQNLAESSAADLREAVRALTELLDTHKDDKTNSHEVTKAQVGLGSVNNWGATSDVTINNTELYATIASVHQAYNKATQALNKSVNHWNYVAVGGEVEIELPYVATYVDSVTIQGIRQVKDKAWEFDKTNNLVRVAEGLDRDDELIITIGMPDAESSNIILKLQDRIDYLESIKDLAPETRLLNVFEGTVLETSTVVSLPESFYDRSILIMFLGGVQQVDPNAYSVDAVAKTITFSETVQKGTTICIIG